MLKDKKFTVYMSKTLWNGLGEAPKFGVNNYRLVAKVDAPTKEFVFNLAQNVNDSWTTNVRVRCMVNEPVRSFSVGDVIKEPSGKLWRCMIVGWEAISEDEVNNMHKN